ncbi:MAG: glycosyltransferase [Polyangiales bacterium]
MIFEDASGKRWKRFVRLAALLLLLAGLLGGVFVAGLYVPPALRNAAASRPRLRAEPARGYTETRASDAPATPISRDYARFLRRMERRKAALAARVEGGAMPLPRDAVVGFTVAGDPAADRSLARHLRSLDVVVPDWFRVAGPGCEVHEQVDAPTRTRLAGSDVLVLPRVANLVDGHWERETLKEMMSDDVARRCVVRKLVDRLVALDADGLNVDLEALSPDDSEAYLEFLVDLRTALHEEDLRLTVDVSIHDPAYDLEYVGNVADAVLVMAYDQHFPSSAPGPIASRTWFAEAVEEARVRIPADRLVVALGSYCYDWRPSSGQPAEALPFGDAMARAAAAGAHPELVREVENTRFAYRDAGGQLHDVFCLDALSVANQGQHLASLGLGRVALWRLGSEDETLYPFLSPLGRDARADLASIPPPRSEVRVVGEGEVLGLVTRPRAGHRRLERDRGGRIVHAVYAETPSGTILERRGHPDRGVVLTFDDGPDPEWTPRILDVLRAHHAKATFFVLGERATLYPELVRRIVAEGHLVGNHTYHHPHLDTLDRDEIDLELHSTQRVLEGLVGRGTPLYRPPFTDAFDPFAPAELAVQLPALEAGYLFVGAEVDPRDWSSPGAAAIASRIVDEVRAGGRIVLLHDGGGNRRDTVEGLRLALPRLEALGTPVVPLDRYADVAPELLLQRLSRADAAVALASTGVTTARGLGFRAIQWLFLACTALAALRILFLAFLVLRGAKKPLPSLPDGFRPLVTVLVPAYNEGKVIASTIASLLESVYREIEIVVIDDGSTDDTAEVVERIATTERRVRCLRKPNGGKADAANHGLAHARGSIVVAVDADTVIDRMAIHHLVSHFADASVTAVCGNVEVGNTHSALTVFQAIEYVTSQNFDRRAFAALNSVTVVPGALGAWRREAVLAVGGYGHDTLTEDADLTLSVLRNGGRITYEPRAIARTEAPETLTALWKQRFRWTYGTYQCLGKHRSALFRGPLGWFGLPNILLFQVLFPLVSPIGDFVLLLSLLSGDFSAILAGYAGFLAMDVVASALAFRLDRKPMRWLLLLLVQRFTYRQFMYLVSLKSMLAVLEGARHGWKKLDRTGSVAVTLVGGDAASTAA